VHGAVQPCGAAAWRAARGSRDLPRAHCRALGTPNQRKRYVTALAQLDLPRTPKAHEPLRTLAEKFAQLKPRDQAEALTLASARLYHKIDPDEFAFHFWGDKEQRANPRLTQHLTTYVDRFNRVGYWVATEVCARKDIKARALEIERFIRVAKV